MFRVNGFQIMVTAGDTGLLAIVPKEGGYTPTADDRAILTVRKRPGKRPLIEKVLVPESDGTVFAVFTSEDTEKLGGKEYCWEIRYALGAQTDGAGKVVGWREMITPMIEGNLLVLHGGAAGN